LSRQADRYDGATSVWGRMCSDVSGLAEVWAHNLFELGCNIEGIGYQLVNLCAWKVVKDILPGCDIKY